VPGAGAKAHADEHCESTMTVQLSGTKRWRVGPPPAITRSSFSQSDSLADGLLTRKLRNAWVPAYEFDLHEGDILFFPPCYIHESLNIGDECAVSITYQWMAPAPVGYLRTFMKRLSVYREMSECRAMWSPMATFLPHHVVFGPDGDDDTADVDSVVAVIRTRIDGNGDGVVTRSEINAFLRQSSEHDALWAMALSSRRSVTDEGGFWGDNNIVNTVLVGRQRVPGGGDPLDELRSYLVDAMHDFHDDDGNGVVTVDEATRVTTEWLAADADARPVRRFLEHWAAIEGDVDCADTDSVPTWAHDPEGLPQTARDAGCEQAVIAYRALLAEHGLVPPTNGNGGAGGGRGGGDDTGASIGGAGEAGISVARGQAEL
jgi:hypothetical protein